MHGFEIKQVRFDALEISQNEATTGFNSICIGLEVDSEQKGCIPSSRKMDILLSLVPSNKKK
jgi:hypothetical protein